jgi:hypothetical protein
MAATIRNAVRDLDPAIPIRTSSEWRSQLAMSFFPAQVATVALGLFGIFWPDAVDRGHLRPGVLYSQQATA